MNDFITNGTEIKQRILYEVSNAKQCIYVAMAYFTDREIAMAIVEAKNRNVFVDIILSSNAQNETVKLILRGAGINVHAFEIGDERGIMHHKFCLIDNRISINGSYNYSINASTNNVENITVSDDPISYSQMLLEFERLKHNIDNRISVNETTADFNKPNNHQAKTNNTLETFSKRLHDIVFSAAQIDTSKYRQQGYEDSRKNEGNLDIFRAEYEHIKEKIRTYATDEGLGNLKNMLLSNISIAYEDMKSNLELDGLNNINHVKRRIDLEKEQIAVKINELKNEKSIVELGDQSTGKKGILQINNEIDKNRLEIGALNQSFIIKQFWSISSISVLILLTIFVFYLSIFFASAFYKVFFEADVIRTALQAGLTPRHPQIIDANAIIRIFKQEGVLFGLISALFFIIPVLLSNLKILGSKNKIVNNLLFWVGLLIFDILVSTMVVVNIYEIKSLIEGRDSAFQLVKVIQHVEFWLIFLFGMFPLIITHFLIENLINAYNNSQRDLVDAEKNQKIQFLERNMADLSLEKEILVRNNMNIDDMLNQQNTGRLNLEIELNTHQTQIEAQIEGLLYHIKTIYNDYIARITSGKIFTDVIFNSVISAYKSGFIAYLPEYYANEQVGIRVREIEQLNGSLI